MPCIVRRRESGAWTKLLLSERDAISFASATLNAVLRRGDDLHDAVLYITDDEDADRLLARLNDRTELDSEP